VPTQDARAILLRGARWLPPDLRSRPGGAPGTNPRIACSCVRSSKFEVLSFQNFWLHILARPAAGLSATAAAARLNSVWPALSEDLLSARWPVARKQALASSQFVFNSGTAGWSYLREICLKPLVVLMSVAALALVLSTVGLYGLLAYGVAQRAREIGIRLALGANARHVVWDVVFSGVRLVGLGLAIGMPAAWLLSKPVRSMLFGLTPTDRPTLFAAAIVLVAAALVAAAVPARRAASVEPIVVLKQD